MADGGTDDATVLFEDECKTAVEAAAVWAGEITGPYCCVRAADHLVTSTECMFLYALSSPSLTEALRPTMTPESLHNLEKFVPMEAPVCAICRRCVDELCPICALADVDLDVPPLRRRRDRKRELVARVWGATSCVSTQGVCRHIYHEHCIQSWICSKSDPEGAKTYGYSKHGTLSSAPKTTCPMCMKPWQAVATLTRQPPSCPQDIGYKRRRRAKGKQEEAGTEKELPDHSAATSVEEDEEEEDDADAPQTFDSEERVDEGDEEAAAEHVLAREVT